MRQTRADRAQLGARASCDFAAHKRARCAPAAAPAKHDCESDLPRNGRGVAANGSPCVRRAPWGHALRRWGLPCLTLRRSGAHDSLAASNARYEMPRDCCRATRSAPCVRLAGFWASAAARAASRVRDAPCDALVARDEEYFSSALHEPYVQPLAARLRVRFSARTGVTTAFSSRELPLTH